MHWATKYVGLPYEPAARGPDKVDCWGLVYLAYQEQYNIQLPLYPGVSLLKPIECSNVIRKALHDDWVPVDEPQEGFLVAMSQREEIHHVGLFIIADGGRIVHCWNSKMVVVDRPRTLKLRGIRVLKYYRHSLWPS